MTQNLTDSIKIIQITDTHLFSTDAGKLQGYSTNQLFSNAIEQVKPKSKNVDFVFLTGDISQDHSIESYEYAASQLNQLDAPVYWIGGNHDHVLTVQSVFSRYDNLHQLTHLSTSNWDFITINTCREGTDSGYIEPEEIERFLVRLGIAKKNKKQIAVVMHHHPVAVDTPLVDDCMLQDNEAFLKIAKEDSDIKLIICGHVHNDYHVMLGDKKLEACPATCFQWKKGTSTLETEDKRAFKNFIFDKTSYTSTLMYF